MKVAVNALQMKQIDDYTVEEVKIPALVLMERAALQVADFMKERLQKTDYILAVCGPGNNGGDGIAAGRILSLQGYQVAILFIGDETKATPQTKVQLEIARNLKIPFENNNKLHEYNIIIDAIFGVGLSRPVSGEFKKVIDQINENKAGLCSGNAKQHIVYSVDLPSGISSDHGKILNVAVKADYTITFGLMKQGLLLYPGADYAGEIIVADIGFPKTAINQAAPTAFYYDKEDLSRLPARKSNGHKGNFGKVLVIAGCKGMSGAAYLSAKAAYKTGAGLVKVLTSYENRLIMQTSLPEALFSAYDLEADRDALNKAEILSSMEWASVIVIGPGLGQSELAEKLLDFVLKEVSIPLIIDADALNLLSKRMDIEYHEVNSRWNYLSGILKENTILTPHKMEMSRLLGLPISEVDNNMIDTVGQSSYNSNLIVAVKDARTIVMQNAKRYINVSGNNGMATGGSGDVLNGIIAALIAQGMSRFEAACLAVYIHGLAGDDAANRKGTYSLMAGDIIEALENVLKGDYTVR
jgi:NAD(P)H-hydrate epimerase